MRVGVGVGTGTGVDDAADYCMRECVGDDTIVALSEYRGESKKGTYLSRETCNAERVKCQSEYEHE